MSYKVNIEPDEFGNAPQVQLSGSNVPNAIGPWTQIASIPYSQMPGSGANAYPTYPKVLTPTARKRLFLIVNSLNQQWTCSFFVTDSEGQGSESSVGIMNTTTLPVNITHYYFDSGSIPQLGSLGDSIKMTITSGSTVATSGSLSLWVREVL